MKKIVIGLSGGMDSATLLGYYLDKGYEAHCCSFNYGSKHNEFENKAAIDVVGYYQNLNYPVHQKFFDLSDIFADFKSDLLLSGGKIPEGHYNDENMRSTVVPGRNLILASIMAGYAESIGAEAIGLGVHAGDHHIYPDCRPDFICHLNETIVDSTDGRISVVAPFSNLNKSEILAIGYNSYENNTPYHLTRTCYKNQEKSCGKCGSCRERLEAFANINKIDPIEYE